MYYQQFRRIYSVSHHLETEKIRLKQVVNELKARIRDVELKLNNGEIKKQVKLAELKNENQSEENKSKRARRTAEEIEKKFKCQVPFCQRYYGSEGSLQQHIKLKHPQMLQRESSDQYRPSGREKYEDGEGQDEEEN